jgi:hypothetical protein
VTSPPTMSRVATPQKGGGLPSHFGPNHEWRTARGAEDNNTSRGPPRPRWTVATGRLDEMVWL